MAERIAVFGAGYAGLVTGAGFADLGHHVVVRDVVPEKIEALRSGRVPFHEPGLDEVLARAGERLRFTLDPAEAVEGAGFVFVCVGTPADLLGRRRPLGRLDGAGRAGRARTGRRGRDEEHGAGRRGRRFALRSLPAASSTSATSLTPSSSPKGRRSRLSRSRPDRDRLLSDADGDRVEGLHDGLDAPVVRTDVPSAEMVKLAANAFLGTRISFINEIANVCELVGADVEKVAYGMGLDARIGTRYLQAGIGFGGSCFPKDISFLKLLAGNSGYHFQLLNAVIEVNELQKRRVVQKLQKHLGSLRGKTVALLGLAFKPHTDDMREAPSIVLASRLLAEGGTCVPGIPSRTRGRSCGGSPSPTPCSRRCGAPMRPSS